MNVKRSLAAVIAILCAVVYGGSALAAPAHHHELPDSQLAELRRATAQFQRLEVALAAGYELGYVNGNGVRIIAGCIAHPTLGAMGYHYFNKGLIDDLVVDPLKPEGLVYETSASGQLKLVSVEYASRVLAPSRRASPSRLPCSECRCTSWSRRQDQASTSTMRGSGSTTPPACSPTGIRRSAVP